MKTYIGTKVINATPMNRLDYNILRGWGLPANEDGTDEGYLVEYTDGGKPNMEGYAGYVSWSPKEQFDKAYRETSGLTFGFAVEAMKLGKKVARAGWNGKGMWLSLSCNPNGDAAAGRREIAFENFWSNNNSEFARQNGGSAVVLPCITMKTADNAILMGWLASQTDVLADDWMIVT
jgi:hypothetical protein